MGIKSNIGNIYYKFKNINLTIVKNKSIHTVLVRSTCQPAKLEVIKNYFQVLLMGSNDHNFFLLKKYSGGAPKYKKS